MHLHTVNPVSFAWCPILHILVFLGLDPDEKSLFGPFSTLLITTQCHYSQCAFTHYIPVLYIWRIYQGAGKVQLYRNCDVVHVEQRLIDPEHFPLAHQQLSDDSDVPFGKWNAQQKYYACSNSNGPLGTANPSLNPTQQQAFQSYMHVLWCDVWWVTPAFWLPLY